jgi:putative cell wall-binding protein
VTLAELLSSLRDEGPVAVEAELRSGYEVERIAGAQRYATAAALARRIDTVAGVGAIDGDRGAILVSGRAFPDALTSGPLAYRERLPVLLTTPGALPADTRRVIDDRTVFRDFAQRLVEKG